MERRLIEPPTVNPNQGFEAGPSLRTTLQTTEGRDRIPEVRPAARSCLNPKDGTHREARFGKRPHAFLKHGGLMEILQGEFEAFCGAVRRFCAIRFGKRVSKPENDPSLCGVVQMRNMLKLPRGNCFGSDGKRIQAAYAGGVASGGLSTKTRTPRRISERPAPTEFCAGKPQRK